MIILYLDQGVNILKITNVFKAIFAGDILDAGQTFREA